MNNLRVEEKSIIDRNVEVKKHDSDQDRLIKILELEIEK